MREDSHFAHLGDEIVQSKIKAARASYDHAGKQIKWNVRQATQPSAREKNYAPEW
jgi:hypothetical protein